MLYSMLWCFSGDGKLKIREELGQFIHRSSNITMPAQHNTEMIDFEVKIRIGKVQRNRNRNNQTASFV